MKHNTLIAVVAAATMLTACDLSDSGVYTLYRSSLVPGVDRINVATFDVDELDAAGNRENCQLAASLFQAQLDVSTKFWCEAGRYRSE